MNALFVTAASLVVLSQVGALIDMRKEKDENAYGDASRQCKEYEMKEIWGLLAVVRLP